MARPSIFSREYERRMKRRRRMTVLSIVVIILGITALFLTNVNFSEYSKKLLTDTKQNTSEPQPPVNSEQVNIPPVEETKEKTLEVTLNAETRIKILYEANNGVNIFKSIYSENPAISFVLNPAATGMVIFDSKLQSMWYINNSGIAQEITSQSYKSYSKISVLEKRPDYVWCTSPKFIDNENIAYLSQLPYIGRSTKKYVWAVNINDINRHTYKTSLGGENISLGNVTDKGLEVIIESSTRYITYSGSTIQTAK